MLSAASVPGRCGALRSTHAPSGSAPLAAALVKLASRLASALPAPVLYRAAAYGFRARKEQRILLLDDLVPSGGTAVDAGAWWGPWTYWLSRRADRVWSFEPNPEMAANLRRVVGRNVSVEEVALSDHEGDATLHVPTGRGPDALGTLHAEHGAPGSQPVPVHTSTLDQFELDDVRFVKIDVENHEEQMLRGAAGTLDHFHPNLLVEIEQRYYDTPIAAVFGWLAEHGYKGWLRRDGAWDSIDSFDVDRDQLDHVEHVHRPEYINNFVFMTPDRRPGSPTG
jgi:FkbM family methyltransferase